MNAPFLSTADSTLLSGIHGRQRRQERNIQKVELQRARRYGFCEGANNGCVKYTYGGTVFIYDQRTNREVTTYPSSDRGPANAGTRFSEPVMLAKADHVDSATIAKHKDECRRIFQEKNKWKSHAVFVVDMSGSMRRDDVNGARCRSDGVWLALARDFVKSQLEARTTTEYDLVSIVCMQEKAIVIVKCEPIDWVLYNKLIDLREWTTIRPNGHGHYMPALTKAEQLLDMNPSGNCSLSLLFFSDGKPSDKGDFPAKMGQIAAKYRRRLTVKCVGLANGRQECFQTLRAMVKEAAAYGSVASFSNPSLSSVSLSNICTSLVSSLATSKTELTDVATGNSRVVRTDVTREKSDTPEDLKLTDDWLVFHNSDQKHYVRRVWTWSSREDQFVRLMDPRCIFCFQVVASKDMAACPSLGLQCPGCQACFVCHNCDQSGIFKILHYKSVLCEEWLRDRRRGTIIAQPISSFSVAMKKPIFDEGVERIVHKFRFLDGDDKFVGPKMVAKESRFVEEHGTYRERMHYMSEFMRTQAWAEEFAKQFNDALDALVQRFPAKRKVWLDQLPRIRFLEPLVVECVSGWNDRWKKVKEFNILIEEMLEGKYEKYNNNMGMVKGQDSRVAEKRIKEANEAFQNRKAFSNIAAVVGGLGAIEEETEEDEIDKEDDDDDIFDFPELTPIRVVCNEVKDEDFPQAFSHFTFEKSKKKLMVVDLQGTFQINKDGTREYRLTDPVIHKHNRSSQLRNRTFGRTDRGEKGMRAFWATHKCTAACRLFGLGEHL